MKILDQIANSGTAILITDNPISEIYKYDIKVNGVSISTATIPGVYYNVLSDTVISGRALIKIFNLTTNTCYLFSATTFTNPGIEFWSDNFDAAALDTSYKGGTWSNGVISDALGVNPQDLIIDGDSFMSPSVSFAPEELVPGHTADSLGINVYTKGPDSYATVISGSFDVVANQTTTFAISIFPDNFSGIKVYYNNTIFDRSTVTNFSTSNQFFIDGRYLILPPQTTSGRAGYTFVRIGGIGLIDYISTDVPVEKLLTTSTAIVESLISYDDAEYVYVMVNGKEIGSTVSSGVYYALKANSYDSYRASVEVYNLNTVTTTVNTIEAWFFNTPYVKFNKMNEEVFQITSVTTNKILAYPPGSWEPYSDKIIVEISNSASSTERKRLIPPYTSNYFKFNDNRIYDIDNRIDNGIPLNYLSTVTAADIFVYANGVRIRPGYDFNFDLPNKKIELVPNLYPDGTYISIVALGGSEYDYIVSGDILQFRSSKSDNNVKVTSFTNHDQLFINNEVFDINPLNLYQLEYPAQDENYVWVYLDGYPLIHRQDFEILSDRRTLQIANDIVTPSSTKIMVTSIKNPEYLNKVYGYRIFKDFFGRDQFKRLSAHHTTFLVENLKFYDTKAKVFDSTVLSPTIPSRNVPGVVLIDRERIEFFNQDFDQLQELRRGTLGTSPSFYIDEGGKVIDQGIYQTIPYYETEYYHTTITTTASTYTIPFFDSNDTSTSYLLSNVKNGITLNTSTLISPSDQILVYFGGYQLNKSSYVKYYEKINDVITIPAEFNVQVINTSYSTSTVSTVTSTNFYGLLPDENFKLIISVLTATSTITNYSTATIIQNSTTTISTGTVGDSLLTYSVTYSYNTGTYISIENLPGSIVSTVTISLVYQHVTLNIRDRLEPGIQLHLTKKEGAVWTNNESLLTSNDDRSTFIREEEADLPDVYFYGGDPRLLDSNNVPLTLDETDDLYTDLGLSLILTRF